MPDFTIRPATAGDSAVMLTLLRELADYEKLLHGFRTTEAIIQRDFFVDRVAHCDLAFEQSEPVGIVTFFWTYGSFSTLRGLFVEDLFVRPGFRGKGYGKALLKHLAGKGADRLDWWVLDWNKPALEFYQEMGARPVEGWTSYRLDGEALQKLGAA